MTSRKFRSPAAAAASVVALVALAAGCSSTGPGAGTPALQKTSITVGVFPTIDSAGLFVAQMEGYFKARGLNVTLKFEPTSQDAVNDQRAGRIDISSADYVTYINNDVRDNAHLRIIAGASLLKSGELQLLVPAHSQISTIGELAGKTIGVAAPGDIATLLIDELLSENGVPPGRVVYKPGTVLQDAPEDLSKGDFAAAPVPEPFASNGEELYGVQELADLDQGATENFPLQGYAVSDTWAQQNPGTLDAFVAALTQGQQLADADRSVVEKAAEKFLNVPARTAALISLPDFPLSVTSGELERIVHAMAQFGLLPKNDASFNVSSMLG